jgi:hypothetical protein
MTDTKAFTKEAKPRRPVTDEHYVIQGAVAVLEEQQAPMTSVAIFRRGVERGLFKEHEYNTVRARLSQHCDLPDARIVRAAGTKVGVRGSRTTAWVLAEQGGIQVLSTREGPVVVPVRIARPARRAIPALRILLTDKVLVGAPASVRAVRGRTAREALLSNINPAAVRWLVKRLRLERRLGERLVALARDVDGRSALIEVAERRRARTA